MALEILARLAVPSALVDGWTVTRNALDSLDAAAGPHEAWARLLSDAPKELRDRIAARLNFSRSLRRSAGCPP